MIDKAKTFAVQAHQGQKRKGSSTDYIVHPIRVAKTLQQSGFKKEVICAGFLHDVVEDTSYELVDIEREFGAEVARLVAAHTEDKTKSWKERKRHTIETVKSAPRDIKALIIADKLDNLQSLKEDLENKGETIWQHFNAGYEQQKWYNESIAEVMENGLAPDQTPNFFHTYQQLIKQTFD